MSRSGLWGLSSRWNGIGSQGMGVGRLRLVCFQSVGMARAERKVSGVREIACRCTLTRAWGMGVEGGGAGLNANLRKRAGNAVFGVGSGV